jgi:hypothetical protein
VADNAGPLLIRAGLITSAQLKDALAQQKKTGATLAEYLVAARVLDEDRLCNFYRERLLVPRVGRAELEKVLPKVISLISSDMASEFRVVPIEVDRDKNLALAMIDPSDTHAVDEIGFFTGLSVFRVVAPPTAIAWALHRYYGVPSPLAAHGNDGGSSGVPVEARPRAKKQAVIVETPPKRKAEIVESVYDEDTPLPAPVPFDQTGRVSLITQAQTAPDSIAPPVELPALPAPPTEPAPLPEVAAIPAPESDAALPPALTALETADERDAVAAILVAYLVKLCRRAAFFVVKKGELGGWVGGGLGVYADSLRQAVLSLDVPSTFRDVVQTRLPFRGPVSDPPSRDFLIDGLSWAPTEMLAIPIVVRDRVVGVLYGDDRMHTLPDEHLAQLARAAQAALERALVAKKGASLTS